MYYTLEMKQEFNAIYRAVAKIFGDFSKIQK
jgi:hypothetical protein